MTVQFGFGINPSAPAEAIAAVAEAETIGFKRVGIWDSPALFNEPWVTLGACARATTQIRLGPWVTNPLTRHPVVTASALATLDDLAPGRAILGIGTGDSGVYHLGGSASPLARLEAYVVAVRRLLEEGEATWDGKRVTLAWARRRIPVWIAAHGERALQLAGRIGDGVIVGLGVAPDVVARCLTIVDEATRSVDRASSDLEIWFTSPWCVDPDRDRARAEAAWRVASLAHHVARRGVAGKLIPAELADGIVRLGEAYDLATHGAPPEAQKETYRRIAADLGILDALIARYAIAGSPEEAESQVRAAVAAGARAFDGANDAPAGSVMVRPRAFADLVLPRVADLTRSSADA